ncbi:MAG TPA: hypothetical protein VNL96_06420 [Gemmatimonadaceae bacterium]|nr:hypothetical protein [Gemmatimonadaceae bacterium]
MPTIPVSCIVGFRGHHLLPKWSCIAVAGHWPFSGKVINPIGTPAHLFWVAGLVHCHALQQAVLDAHVLQLATVETAPVSRAIKHLLGEANKLYPLTVRQGHVNLHALLVVVAAAAR